jgi:uncharacterized protein (TIGR03437 family)
MESRMLRKSWLWVMAGAVLTAGSALAGVFGTVVPIGGEGADLALDETRGFLYIADFTANRIDVMSLANNQIQTSINVPAQPSSLSISQDGHWLAVAQYGNNAAPASQKNGLTLIDLTNDYAQQNFALGNPPLGVSFGVDGNALVVTTGEFMVFNPSLGTTSTLLTISQAAALSIPVPIVSFPPNITGASLAVSADYTAIYGLATSTGGLSLTFYYDVVHHTVHGQQYTSSPTMGPVAVSVARDGSYAVMGWIRVNQALQDTAEYGTPGNPPSGVFNLGGHAIDSANNKIYSQVALGTGLTSNGQGLTPLLQVLSSDNLTLLDTLSIPENLSGKAVLKSDSSVIYALSSSGVTVLPVGSLNQYPRLTASVHDILFLDDFCARNATSQTFTITDPGGNHTAFSISSSNPGVTVSPSSGVTPAVITVSVDPNAFGNQNGTTDVTLLISSGQAVDAPSGLSITVLVNAPQPSQRGSIVNIPGTLVDLLSDNTRVRYYVLRQNTNQVLVFNGANNTQIAALSTCTYPMSMTETFDGNKLLVGCDRSQIISVFDLNAMQPLTPVTTPGGYVQSIAVSNGLNLAVMRNASGGQAFVAAVDLILNQATELPTLGVYQNQLSSNNTVLAPSPNGATIMLASTDGHVMLYDANVNSFTVARQDFTSLVGPYAASAFGQYVVGSHLLNSSLAPLATFSTATETSQPSGFVFVNQTGYLTAAPNTSSPGVVQAVNLSTGGSIQPTAIVEAPLLAGVPPNSVSGTACNTTTNTTATGSSQSTTCQTGLVTTTTTCTTSTSSSGGTTTTSQNCTTNTVTATQPPNTFSRSLVMLQDGSELVNLTTSGIVILPPGYAASIAPPQITAVVSGADFKSPAAPGGLITAFGTSLSPTNAATSEIPLPTALASSCMTVNGQPIPLIFVSPTQVNAQMPFQAIGDVVVVVHTPAGVSPNFNMVVQPTAPAVFLSGSAGPLTDLPTVVRQSTNLIVTTSNPVHLGDMLIIYLTGMGAVSPVVPNGTASPENPPAIAIAPPQVTLGGVALSVQFAGLAPGEVGVNQINAIVPANAPQGMSVPLVITQGGSTQTINNLRVVQ